jgi:aminoglycoside 2'-N-acetyltransferase I
MTSLPGGAASAAESLRIEVTPSIELSENARKAMLRLCQRAYGEDLEALYQTFPDPTHVLAFCGNQLVSHALWVTRWLQYDHAAAMRTAYVEFVATDPTFQGHGYASAVMGCLARAVEDYDLAALCTGTPQFYRRFGWFSWQGSLFIRSKEGPIPTPSECVMILALPKTPALDPSLPLSAEWREGELW